MQNQVLIALLSGCLLTGCFNNDTDSSSPGSDDACTSIELRQAFTWAGNFSKPVFLLQHPQHNRFRYVIEQRGELYRLDSDNESKSLVIDLDDHVDLASCSECGLLGMAFHPNFAGNGIVYLSYTENRGGDMFSVVSRFAADNTVAGIDAGSRDDIFEYLQPYSNHNGGHIAFGPDGFLYFGLGDGGSGNDPEDHAQTLTDPLGTMLRMQDNGAAAAGNPFGNDARIFAYGLRNPWRWSFDRDTGELWVADVGQNAYEEVDIVTLGGNYGWRCYEGFHRTGNSCSAAGPFIDPVAEYGRSEGISITGGYVYRGADATALNGVYLFGDYGSGRIWGLSGSDGDYTRQLLRDTDMNISSFAEDNDGRVYVIDYKGGIYRIESGDCGQ